MSGNKIRQLMAVASCAVVAALCLCACAGNEDTPVKNNVVFDGNVWVYVDDNGVPDKDFSGIAENEYGSWLITDGTVDFGFTGPYYYDGIYHIIVDGKDYSRPR